MNNKKTEKNDKNTSKQVHVNATARDMLGIISIILVAAILFLFIALNFSSEESTIAVEDRYQAFGRGWHLVAGERDEMLDLPTKISVGPNETIVLTKELPTLSQYYAVATRNYHMALTASVEGNSIYQFPLAGKKTRSYAITDDWNLIKLDESMSGKPITIEFKAGDFGFSGYIKPFYIGEDNTLVHYLRSTTALPYGMAVSVLTFGIILLVLGIVYSKYNYDKSQIIAGLMLVSIGIWVTNRSKMPLLLMGSSFKYYLAVVSLMLEAVLILLYVGEKFKNKNRKLTSGLIYGFGAVLLAVFIIVTVINFPLDRVVPVAYFAIFLASVYLLYMLWQVSFGKECANLTTIAIRSNRIEFIATTIMVAGVVIGVISDFVLGSDRLWTDIGALPKIALNSFAIGQILVHVYKGYYGVEEREKLQGKLHESQMELMMGQIQPHFIFNTLSSIRTLVKVDPDVAYNMIYDFSNYLRANVDNVTNLDGINFASEVDHINSYVNIEKVRFGDRLHVEYDIKASDFMVPPLSIQPLIENAIKHGVMKKVGGGTVLLKSYTEGNYNIVEVIDDGIGFTPERLEEIKASLTDDEYSNQNLDEINLTGNGSENHKSSGMRNIYLRLKELSNAELSIESAEDQGTKITVKFPIEEH